MPSTPPSDRGCPSAVVLAAFLRAELSPAESDDVRFHLAACPDCGSRVNDPTPRTTPAGRSPATVADPYPVGASVATPAVLPAIGQYQLVEQIGKGGMGVVYRAQHLRLKRWVALKLLADRRLIDGHLVVRFEREMEIVGRLDHPNLVRATDAGSADGYHYLAMDLIDGPNLSQLLHQAGELPVAAVCELVRQAAVGLQHAHEHGLIHRDIKPNNVMVTPAGVVKVLDLGLARLSRVAEGEALTGTGAVMGTPDYMAPEQWDATKAVDIRADVYSLGCTLHALLAKRPPFAALDSPAAKQAAHEQAAAPRLAEDRSDVPAGVQAVIDRALAKDPAQRFQTPAEFAAALAEFARGADLPAVVRGVPPAGGGPATVSYASAEVETAGPRPAPVAPRRRRRLRAVAAVLVLSAVTLAVAISRPPRSTEEAPPPPAAAKPKVNEWFDLPVGEPKKVVWPQGLAGTNSRLDYIPADRQFGLHVADRAMAELITLEDVDFELECTIHQSPWLGGVGVYFGDHSTGTDHEAVVVSLDGFGLFLDKPSVPIQFSTVQHDGPVFRYHAVHGYTAVPKPINSAHTLWLAAYRSGVYKVQWGGQTNPVTLAATDKQPRPRMTAGGLGVYAHSVSSQFRNLRLRILSPIP